MALLRVAAGLTIAIGAALALWTLLSKGLPVPLFVTLLLASVLEVAVGIGIWRGSRAAWSFALAVAGVMALALILALPAMMRGGASVALGGAALAAIGAELVLLISARREL